MPPRAFAETHTVTNQPPPLDGANLYRLDLPLQAGIRRHGAAWAEARLDTYGALAGGPLREAGLLAERYPPRFSSHDRYGHRIDLVEFHPAYHTLMRTAVEHGLPSLPWASPGAGAQVARAALVYLHMQADAGSGCPLTMTFAAVPALRRQPSLAADWLPKVLAPTYDPRNVGAAHKAGVTLGMAMTEKQGGTDVRANTTRAWPMGQPGPGQAYELVGHKWFYSAPMSDAFLTLAQTDQGLSCFLLPRHRPDDSRNLLYIQRLKDKLGNRSNASSEVEFSETFGFLLGTPGDGVRTILDMVTLTRLDCALASAGIMRASMAEAVHHVRGRMVFGKTLIDQPLMTRVLADMALDVAAATALAFRLADSFDKARESPVDAAYARVMTPVAKYWICKIAPSLIYEAMECIGGSGYVEERPIARHYREAPVNAIWEGSGNVMALDVLRVLSRGKDLFETLFAGLERDLGPSGKKTVEVLRAATALAEQDEAAGRLLIEQLALAAGAAELYRLGAGKIADAFLESRLAGGWRHTYGVLDARFDSRYVIDLLYPPAT